MSFLYAPSSTISQSEPMLHAGADIVSFVGENADDLLWVGGAAGGHNGRAAAADLIDTVLSRPDDLEMIRDLVIVVRDALLEGHGRVGSPSTSGRADLDAAQRWFGARLDEFAARLP